MVRAAPAASEGQPVRITVEELFVLCACALQDAFQTAHLHECISFLGQSQELGVLLSL